MSFIKHGVKVHEREARSQHGAERNARAAFARRVHGVSVPSESTRVDSCFVFSSVAELPPGSCCWGTVDGALAVQVPWFVLPSPCEVQPQGGRSPSGHRPVGHQLTLLCFSQIVPAAKLGNHALKWLFVQEMCDLKWSLTPRQSALVPSALHLTQGRWLVAGAGGDTGTRGPVAARWDPPGCSHGWECPAE